jgi:putative PIN family toxin of toxin-antitoxin system
MKVVLDTNVLLAAFIAHGTCHEVVEHCAIHHDIILSRFILDEMRDKLANKFNFTDREAMDAAELMASRATIVTPQKLERPVCRDTDDDAILGTAIAGACACIVTGDKDLLVLKHYHGIRIVTPSDFWALDQSAR